MSNIDFSKFNERTAVQVEFFDEKGIVVDGKLIEAKPHWASDARLAAAILGLQERIEQLEGKVTCAS